VPDPSYGIRFDARTVTKGTVLAIVTRDPLPLSKRFATRAIAVVPSEEVADTVLPELTALLGDKTSEGDGAVKSIATLHYEIVP
jgi:metacaspase-1